MSEFWFGFMCGAATVGVVFGGIIAFLITLVMSVGNKPFNW